MNPEKVSAGLLHPLKIFGRKHARLSRPHSIPGLLENSMWKGRARQAQSPFLGALTVKRAQTKSAS